jgi:hypothetical protein
MLAVGIGNPDSISRGTVVFVDQPAEQVPPANAAGTAWGASILS